MNDRRLAYHRHQLVLHLSWIKSLSLFVSVVKRLLAEVDLLDQPSAHWQVRWRQRDQSQTHSCNTTNATARGSQAPNSGRGCPKESALIVCFTGICVNVKGNSFPVKSNLCCVTADEISPWIAPPPCPCIHIDREASSVTDQTCTLESSLCLCCGWVSYSLLHTSETDHAHCEW